MQTIFIHAPKKNERIIPFLNHWIKSIIMISGCKEYDGCLIYLSRRNRLRVNNTVFVFFHQPLTLKMN
jgi:hypothetical protein